MLRALRGLERLATSTPCGAGLCRFATASAVQLMPANRFETPEDIVGKDAIDLIVPALSLIGWCAVLAHDALLTVRQERFRRSRARCGSRGTSWTMMCWRPRSCLNPSTRSRMRPPSHMRSAATPCSGSRWDDL